MPAKVFDSNHYFFGTKFQTYGMCYKGLVDEIVFRNRELTAVEIQQMYATECKRLSMKGTLPTQSTRERHRKIWAFHPSTRDCLHGTMGGWIRATLPLELRQRTSCHSGRKPPYVDK